MARPVWGLISPVRILTVVDFPAPFGPTVGVEPHAHVAGEFARDLRLGNMFALHPPAIGASVAREIDEHAGVFCAARARAAA